MRGLAGELHVTWEEGTCAAWLYDLLKPRVHEVVVCNPRRNTTDLTDMRNAYSTLSAFRRLAPAKRYVRIIPFVAGVNCLR
jgi:hypothetical protein